MPFGLLAGELDAYSRQGVELSNASNRMKIATYNINIIYPRLPNLLALLAAARPTPIGASNLLINACESCA